MKEYILAPGVIMAPDAVEAFQILGIQSTIKEVLQGAIHNLIESADICTEMKEKFRSKFEKAKRTRKLETWTKAFVHLICDVKGYKIIRRNALPLVFEVYAEDWTDAPFLPAEWHFVMYRHKDQGPYTIFSFNDDTLFVHINMSNAGPQLSTQAFSTFPVRVL